MAVHKIALYDAYKVWCFNESLLSVSKQARAFTKKLVQLASRIQDAKPSEDFIEERPPLKIRGAIVLLTVYFMVIVFFIFLHGTLNFVIGVGLGRK